MKSRSTRNIGAALMWPSTVVGSIIIGCALVDVSFLVWPILFGAVILSAIVIVECFRPSVEPYTADAFDGVSEAFHMVTDSSSSSIQEQAIGGYAANELQYRDDLHDHSAVASLVAALDPMNEADEPGWDEVCESIVGTIARTGDARFLPALGRVRLARGLQFRDAVDAAIEAIVCKQNVHTG